MSRCRTSRQKYDVSDPSGSGGFPAPSLYPRLNGKNVVFFPSNLVVMATTVFVTTKNTTARAPNASNGSFVSLPGSVGWREWAYCTCPSTTDWVKSVFNSTVATGSPLRNRTKSMDRFGRDLE